jgi:hypothetical protein
MAQHSESLPVYAQIEKAAKTIVYGAHPTQAKNPNYRPLSLTENHASVTNTPEYGEELVGHGTIQEDGDIRIVLTKTPPSRTLIVRRSETPRV